MTTHGGQSEPEATRSGTWAPRLRTNLVALGALVLAASLALPILDFSLSLSLSTAWLIGGSVAGAVAGGALLSHDRVLASYHELRAWRRKQRFDTWMRIGNQLLETQDYERAAYWYQRLVDAYPSSVEAWYGLASCLEDAQAFEDASRAYERAHQVASGGDDGFLASAAKCAWQADRRDRAVDLIQSLARRDPQFASQVLEREEYRDLRGDERLHEHVADDGLENAAPYA